jgi:hypothetical protein
MLLNPVEFAINSNGIRLLVRPTDMKNCGCKIGATLGWQSEVD